LVNKTLYEKTLASGFGSVHFLLDASEQQQVRHCFIYSTLSSAVITLSMCIHIWCASSIIYFFFFICFEFALGWNIRWCGNVAALPLEQFKKPYHETYLVFIVLVSLLDLAVLVDWFFICSIQRLNFSYSYADYREERKQQRKSERKQNGDKNCSSFSFTLFLNEFWLK
jgi:hypothetical protein